MDNLKKEWEDYAPSPIEFLHGRLMELFHQWRRSKTESTTVEINGIEFSNIIAKAKTETYAKYSDLKLNQPIKKGVNHIDKEEKAKECEIESYVIKYFGLGKDITEKDKIDVDFGLLVDLLYGFKDSVFEAGKQDREREIVDKLTHVKNVMFEKPWDKKLVEILISSIEEPNIDI